MKKGTGMSRCKCCDTPMSKEECNVIAYSNKELGIEIKEDLCTSCKTASLTLYDYIRDKEYQQSFTERFSFDLTDTQ